MVSRSLCYSIERCRKAPHIILWSYLIFPNMAVGKPQLEHLSDISLLLMKELCVCPQTVSHQPLPVQVPEHPWGPRGPLKPAPITSLSEELICTSCLLCVSLHVCQEYWILIGYWPHLAWWIVGKRLEHR